MSTYAIGDIHGCYQELIALLNEIHFDAHRDVLWFSGDLVNRGGQSVEVLRLIKRLGTRQITVLGNNDLSLITVYYGHRKNLCFEDILKAPDSAELMEWLRKQNILHYDSQLQFVLTHAGIYPYWTLNQAIMYAQEVEAVLQGDCFHDLLQGLFGNLPDRWTNNLQGIDRLRFFVNVFTRMRYCTEEGRLDFEDKGPIGTQKKNLVPWFQVNNRKLIEPRILFGHWASLLGITHDPRIFALDTGCAWGHRLSALRLDDLRLFSVTKQ